MTTTAEPAQNPQADNSSGSDATMALVQQLAASQGITLPGEPAAPVAAPAEADMGAPGEDAGDADTGEPAAPSQAAAAPQEAPPARAPKDEPPKDEREFMQRLAARDAKLVAERQARKAAEERAAAADASLQEFEANPVAWLHRRGRTVADLARMSLEMPGQPQAPAAAGGVDLSGLPPELQKALGPVMQKVNALEQQNAELKQRATRYDEQVQAQQLEQRRTQEVGLVSSYLSAKGEDFPLVNDLELHGQVYDRVVEHVRTHGAFETERDAAFMVEQIAREVEQAEAARIAAILDKPRAKQFLLQKLGAQREAKPARQETRAQPGRSNRAAPAVPNSLATQRASRGTPPDWASLPIDEQMRRTVELATRPE